MKASGATQSARSLWCGASQHGLSSNNMTLITSNCGAMPSLRTKWPYSPRVVCPEQVELAVKIRRGQAGPATNGWAPTLPSWSPLAELIGLPVRFIAAACRRSSTGSASFRCFSALSTLPRPLRPQYTPGRPRPQCCPGWPAAGSEDLEQLNMARLVMNLEAAINRHALIIIITNRSRYRQCAVGGGRSSPVS